MTAAPPMDCAQVRDLLDDYRRDTLGTAMRKQVQNHLDHCDACAAELNFRDTLAGHLIDSVPASDAPPYLSPAVQAAIQAPRHKLSQNDRKMVMLPWMFAAAAIIIFAVAFLNNRTQEPLTDRNVVALDKPRPSVNQNEELTQVRLLAVPVQPSAAPAPPAADAAPAPMAERYYVEPRSKAAGTLASEAKEADSSSGRIETNTAGRPLRAAMAAVTSGSLLTSDSQRRTTATSTPAPPGLLP